MQKIARIYLRVSTEEQDLTRQNSIVESAKQAGYYIAGVYREKVSGARADRPELNRMISDLQPGEVVISERIDRISCLPLSEIAAGTEGVAKIVLESVQEMLLKLALQIARDDYEVRRKRQLQGIQQVQIEGNTKAEKLIQQCVSE